MATSIVMSELCMYSYTVITSDTIQVDDYVFKVWSFDEDNAHVDVYECDYFVVYCFRGTDDVKDFCSSIQVTAEDFSKFGSVHTGFAKEFYKIYHIVKASIDVIEKPFFTIGHSMGGAMALLCAGLHFHRSNFVACFTFGMPKCVMSKFVVETLKMVHIRWACEHDSVCRLPLSRYLHHGLLRIIKQRRMWFRTRHHKIKNYYKCLIKFPNLIQLSHEDELEKIKHGSFSKAFFQNE